jgi:hypothetical protein
MMNRVLRIILLLVWLEIGLVLILVPWSDVWDVNFFLYQYPMLGLIFMNPYLRGAISGLGLLNVMIVLDAFRSRTPAVASRS